jgi:thioester reductase-like protein
MNRLSSLSPAEKRELLAAILRRKALDRSEPLDGHALEGEAVLDPAIRGLASPSAAAATDALLTGATGFLGSFLLRELLASGAGRVCCLVRAPDGAAGQRRLQEALRSRGLWNDEVPERVIAVPGDLSAPRLGLPASDFEALGARLRAIFHAGASVSFGLPYRAQWPGNVSGTHEILRLAAVAGAPVHYVSTVAVLGVPDTGSRPQDEDTVLEDVRSLYGGYARTKWVAEKLVRAAAGRGLACTTYRLGGLAGDARTGVCNPADVWWRFVKGCIQLGSIADLAGALNLIPVDFACRAIVALAARPDARGRTFHLVNPASLPIDRLVDWLRDRGYPLLRRPYRAWRGELAAAAPGGEVSTLRSFVEGFPSDSPDAPPHLFRALTTEHVASDQTRRALAECALACPPLDERLLTVCFSYLEGEGFLARPDRPASPPPGG